MEDFFSKIWDFFLSDRISLTPKITIPVVLFLIAFLFVDYYGFFYYYANGKKLDYLAQIEETKEKCASNPLVVSYLEDMEKEAIERKNVFQWFASLFKNEDSLDDFQISNEENNSSSKGLGRIFPPCERNQFWQTLTSSLCWILVLLVLIFSLASLPFSSSHDKLSSLLRLLLGIGGMGFMVWLTQWIFGLIPVIGDRAYINYAIQLIINLSFIIPLLLHAGKNKWKRKKAS